MDEYVGHEPHQFLIYTPWEQFNNQILGFKSACALAFFINRTLVLPLVGASKSSLEERKMFDPLDYDWSSFDLYFDIPSISELLPCSIISFDNFQSLFKDKSLGTLKYHHVSDEVTSESQFRSYYKDIADLKYDKIEWDLEVTYGMSEEELRKLHGSDNSTVLALGSMFWYHNFDITVEYPISKFYDYMGNSVYNQITKGLKFSERLVRISMNLLTKINRPFVSFHLRRGDYAQKCAEMIDKDPRASQSPELSSGISYYLSKNPKAAWKSNITYPLFDSCFTPLFWIQKKIQSLSNLSHTIFVSSNAGPDEKIEISKALPAFQIMYIEDVLVLSDPQRASLNVIDESILDQLLCINSAHFVGNLYSSFSRTIIESRNMMGSDSSVF